MNLKYFLIFIALCMSTLQAENLFEDFDAKTGWRIKKSDEYSKVKPKFKQGEIAIVTTHASESPYLRIVTDKELEEGQSYDFLFRASTKGQGSVNVSYGARALPAKKLKGQGLGLKVAFGASPKWQTYKCTFKVPKKKDSEMKANFNFSLGAFKGEI